MDKKAKQKYIIGTLILVILSASIYVALPDKFKVVVEKTNTKYYIYENDSWDLSATEYVSLFDGTTKMRAKSREVISQQFGKYIIIIRDSTWKDNITTSQKYIFDSTVNDVESTPLSTFVECYNCEGKILQFEYRDIEYNGTTKKIDSPFKFGKRMKVEWDDNAYFSKVYKQKSSDKILIKFKPSSSYEKFNVRMFDPIKKSSILSRNNTIVKKYKDMSKDIKLVDDCKSHTIKTYSLIEYKDKAKEIKYAKNGSVIPNPIKYYRINITKEQVDCYKKYYKIFNKSTLEYPGYSCRYVNETEIMCDSLHDGNGDGYCKSGESCQKFIINKKTNKIERYERNSEDKFIRNSGSYFTKRLHIK